jgi:hypothetical protein
MFANQKSSIIVSAIISFTIFASLMVAGVSFAETGSFRMNKKVATDFEAYRFDPNYDYYFMNLENDPCAVIGLKKDYAVHDILWKKIRPDSKEFKDVIERVKRFPMTGSPAFGAYVLDSQGNTIGVYFSSAGAGVTVNKESKTVLLTMFMGGDRHN